MSNREYRNIRMAVEHADIIEAIASALNVTHPEAVSAIMRLGDVQELIKIVEKQNKELAHYRAIMEEPAS